MHGHQGFGDAHIGQGPEQARTLRLGVGDEVAQDPDEEDVARALEQGGMPTASVVNLLLDEGHGRCKRRFIRVDVQTNGLGEFFHQQGPQGPGQLRSDADRVG